MPRAYTHIWCAALCCAAVSCCVDAGLGIAIVNDFKSIEGDRKMGLQSLPVAFGVDTGQTLLLAAAALDTTSAHQLQQLPAAASSPVGRTGHPPSAPYQMLVMLCVPVVLVR